MYMRMFEDGLQHGVDMAVTGNIRELPNGASFEEKVKVEGKKRPVKQEVDHVYQMDKVKYTKYIISFN